MGTDDRRGRLVAVACGVLSLVVVGVFLVVGGGPSSGARRAAPVPVGGVSVLMTSGVVFDGEVTAMGGGRYRLEARNFSGIYELVGGQLVVREPRDARLTEYVWVVEDDGGLRLVEAPPVAKIGSDYTGATILPRPRGRP